MDSKVSLVDVSSLRCIRVGSKAFLVGVPCLCCFSCVFQGCSCWRVVFAWYSVQVSRFLCFVYCVYVCFLACFSFRAGSKVFLVDALRDALFSVCGLQGCFLVL